MADQERKVSTRTVELELPTWRWFALGALAERRGVSVAELLAAAADHIDRPVGRPKGRPSKPTSQRVAELHARGYTDAHIANLLIVGKATVRYHRAQLGLDPNPAR